MEHGTQTGYTRPQEPQEVRGAEQGRTEAKKQGLGNEYRPPIRERDRCIPSQTQPDKGGADRCRVSSPHATSRGKEQPAVTKRTVRHGCKKLIQQEEQAMEREHRIQRDKGSG